MGESLHHETVGYNIDSYCVERSHMENESDIFNIKYNLGGRMLRMATKPWAPFVLRHRNETSTWYTGLCLDVLDIIAASLNFTYTITQPTDRYWGTKLPNGTWTGLTGMLYRKEADFALAGLSLNADRATEFDYTTGFYYDDLVLISTLPDPTAVGWAFFVRPFHWLVYVLLGCGLLVMAVMLVWLERRYTRMYNSSRLTATRLSVPPVVRSALEAVEPLFGTLFGRAVNYSSVSGSGRILLCTWMLLTLVTTATYTGKLTANSMLIQEPLPFRSLSELVRRTDYRWVVSKGNMMEEILATSNDSDYKMFYQKMLQFAADDPGLRSTSFYKMALPRLLRGNFVYLGSASNYKLFKRKYCRLTLVKQKISVDTFAIYLQKGSPYTKMFNQVLYELKEGGILEYITEKWLPGKSECATDHTTVTSMSLEVMWAAFAVAGCGLVLACMLLGLEYVMSTKNKTVTVQHSLFNCRGKAVCRCLYEL